jgi:hypothetical protein
LQNIWLSQPRNLKLPGKDKTSLMAKKRFGTNRGNELKNCPNRAHRSGKEPKFGKVLAWDVNTRLVTKTPICCEAHFYSSFADFGVQPQGAASRPGSIKAIVAQNRALSGWVLYRYWPQR